MLQKASLILTLLIFFVACNPDQPKSDNQVTSILEDSLSKWVSKSKNRSAITEFRLKQLSKIEKAVSTINIDTLKINYVSVLSQLYSELGDSTKFFQFNKELELLARKINDSTRLAEAYWDKGAYFDLPSVGERDSAYFYLSSAQKIYQQLENDLQNASVLRGMATIQTAINDNTGALVTLTEAIRLLKPLEDNKKLYQAYNIMGIASGALNEYNKALEYYELAGDYLKKSNSKDIAFASLENNIGLVYFEMGDYQKAKSTYEKATIIDSLYFLNPGLYAKLLDHLAMTDFNLGIMTSVEDKLYRSQFIRDSIGDLEGLSLNYYNLALVNKELGKNADAYIFAKNSLDLAGEIDNNLRYLESLKLLAELDPENAITYQRDYINLHDSMQIEERRIRNKFDRIRFETEETELKNQQLSKQKLIWTGIAIGVLLLAISLFIIVDQRVKNQRLRFQQQQQEANQEIFNLMLAQKQKLEEGKQTEQKRISEELHDGILGEMNGVRMILLGLNKKGDDAAVALREQAIEKLKEVQEEIRSISHELNDASYQKFNNFISSIEELLKNSCETAGIDYHFTYDHDLDWDSLEGITKINIYRILQESLQNCIKHANASAVFVSFEINNSDLVISIQDNGRGFDATKEKKGIGHKNIKSRVNKINGRWYLRSAIGIGTTVLVEIPLEHISQEAKKEISLPEDLQEA